ncbi:MAG TPA: PKD domain-containing protein [Gemmatimonadales bacterium]|nr:PKD domain-containing protein [Gemmatimonadales bacterium]
MGKAISHPGRRGVLAAVLLATACRDGVGPERRAPRAALSAATVRLSGVGSIGPGPATPGGTRLEFDLDVASTLTGRVFLRDWAVVRDDGSVGTLTVTATDAATRITAVRDGSTMCADPTHGVEVEGVGRVNSGGDSNPAGDELLNFTVRACDEGPAGSGADLLMVSLPAHGYTAGPDNLSSGDLAKSSEGSPPPANQPPTADFTHACDGLTCSFTSTSRDPDGSITAYAWTFGDGGISTLANPSHTYGAGGTYTVTLTVIDDQGATGSVSQSVTVAGPSPNQPPAVNAGPDETALIGLLYGLSANFTDPDNNGPWSYTIDWGDGSRTTGSKSSQGGISAGHTYLTILPRSFTIRVTVTDAAGASGSDTKVVSVLLL